MGEDVYNVASHDGHCGSSPAERTKLRWQARGAERPPDGDSLQVSQTPANPVAETRSPARSETSCRRRVLLVDDSRAYRRALRMVIESLGEIDVAEAESGEEALAVLTAANPQLVFMDINLPGINGIETTARVLEAAPATVVIGLSIYTDAQTREAIVNAGALTLLNKESDISAVLALVEEYL
jgi:CheY-like chemotaxis protein